ncbi:MAG: hypothetical protein ACKOFW_06635, partial [Planctomycetaceae bacterium]
MCTQYKNQAAMFALVHTKSAHSQTKLAHARAQPKLQTQVAKNANEARNAAKKGIVRVCETTTCT